MIDLTWQPEHRGPVVLILTATAAYVAYHYFASSEVFARRLQGRWEPETVQARSVFLQRASGCALLGIVPTIVGVIALSGSLVAYGLKPAEPLLSLAWVAGAAVFLVPGIAVAARQPRYHEEYPQIRASTWDRRLVLANAATWALYLVAYELFFRGFLLISLVAWIGVWPGLAVMTGLYTFAHLPKGNPGETIGCIPMGFVFGLATLLTGSIWAAVGMHVVIAVSSDMLAVRFNPEMALAGGG